MRFGRTSLPLSGAKPRGGGGFTLVEVLAALLFMAIVIPVTVEGLRLASLAGQLGERKTTAARIADSVLNELVATGQWQNGADAGTMRDGPNEYHWSRRLEGWNQGQMRVLSVEVTFPVQGRAYAVHMSTLVDLVGP